MDLKTATVGAKLSNKEIIGLLVASFLAFLLYSFFSWQAPWRFNSPDEAANAFWAERLSAGQSLKVLSPLNQIAQSPIIHPRSTRIIGNNLQPVSFLGLPLAAGGLAYFFGHGLLPYLTPLLAVLGLAAWYLILRKFFDKPTAVIGWVLLAGLPANWYYQSRPFFHNGGFFSLLLITWWFSCQALQKKSYWLFGLSGLTAGLSVAFRSSEIFWLLLIAIIWFYSYRRQLSWRFIVCFVLGGLIGFSPIILANLIIYGQPLSIAYQTIGLGQAVNLGSTVSLLKQLILPFGWHPKIILNTVGNYLITLNWLWFILVTVGWLWLGRNLNKFNQRQKSIFGLTILISLWLIILYGSWLFNDNPDPKAVTIGTSYVRYWLPVYALALIPAAVYLGKLSAKYLGKYLVAVFLLGYLVWSAYAVIWSEPEGLLRVRFNVEKFDKVGQAVQQLTPVNSVIVSGKTDKFFWPERQVIVNLENQADYLAVVNLLKGGWEVYRFHPTWPMETFNDLNAKRLKDYGLQIKLIKGDWEGFSLYQFNLLNNL